MPYYDRHDDFGGGKVRRAFKHGGQVVRAGTVLTAEQLKSMPVANRRAMIDKGFIATWPAHDLPSGGERHLVHKGFGAYDVVEGRKLNDRPLTREEASKLAGHN